MEWIVILLIAAATYLFRSLPFLLRGNQEYRSLLVSGWMDSLGPCLIAAMAVAIFLPEFDDAVEGGYTTAFFMGVISVAIALRLSRNLGIATLCGILVFWALHEHF